MPDVPGLYLLLAADFDAATGAAALAEALHGAGGARVEAALIWRGAEEEAAWHAAVAAALPILHERGIPLLAAAVGPADLPAGIDGLHLETGASSIAAARAALGARPMLGAGAIASRHDAMLAGESGADYVLFGSADPARGEEVAFSHRLEFAEWWSALFRVPGVALAGTQAEAEALAAAGADFVAVRDLVWRAPGGAAAALAGLARAIDAATRREPAS